MRRPSQQVAMQSAVCRGRINRRSDFVLGSVPHQWIPLASADHVIPMVTQGGARFATANLAYPHATLPERLRRTHRCDFC